LLERFGFAVGCGDVRVVAVGGVVRLVVVEVVAVVALVVMVLVVRVVVVVVLVVVGSVVVVVVPVVVAASGCADVAARAVATPRAAATTPYTRSQTVRRIATVWPSSSPAVPAELVGFRRPVETVGDSKQGLCLCRCSAQAAPVRRHLRQAADGRDVTSLHRLICVMCQMRTTLA
jgi:hypothetical protein